jgi:D-glycerate 3-kinase
MASVVEWRGKQERKLAERSGPDGSKVMDKAALQRFIMHYERLTRSMLTEMPDRADLVFMLNQSQQICGVRIR